MDAFTEAALGNGAKHNAWHLQTLAVDPEYQHRGIGTRLVNVKVDEVKREGSQIVVETPTESNPQLAPSFPDATSFPQVLATVASLHHERLRSRLSDSEWLSRFVKAARRKVLATSPSFLRPHLFHSSGFRVLRRSTASHLFPRCPERRGNAAPAWLHRPLLFVRLIRVSRSSGLCGASPPTHRVAVQAFHGQWEACDIANGRCPGPSSVQPGRLYNNVRRLRVLSWGSCRYRPRRGTKGCHKSTRDATVKRADMWERGASELDDVEAATRRAHWSAVGD
uniref:N-acetyltransferase domain-containing protein n=1 Tax=Mycena chlorophos TaxID=658473 RepID=A0ABQ0L2E6_MYCCL|nr:predicted protein [Mycena chlorophos]